MLDAARLPGTVASPRFNLGRRPTKTRLATEADEKIPIKFHNVPVADKAAIERRMSDDTLQRWRYLWDVAFPEHAQFPPGNERERSTLSRIDTEKGCEAGIIERVTPEMEAIFPTRALGIAFTVVDDRKKDFQPERPDDDSAKKRRFILWTKALNFYAQQQGYEPEMSDLQHPSKFLQDLRFSSTTTGDLTLAFYQHELSQRQRALCRFYNSEGVLLQSTRGIMGHTCFAEIQQIFTAVLAGDPRRCKEEFTLRVPSLRTWIDGVKFSGSEEQMLAAGTFIDEAAAEVGATWNRDERLTAVKYCTFIGGDWDHEAKSIACSEKFLRRLPKNCPQSLSLLEAERLFGRLIDNKTK